MADLKITFELRLTQRMARWCLAAALLACCAPELASEGVTLTTYYPAPSGVYSQMITTGNAFLARDSGQVSIGLNAQTAVTGQYGLLPGYVPWGTFGTGAGGAAIYNDAGSYKALMVVGNSSGGGGRQVQLWDNVTLPNGGAKLSIPSGSANIGTNLTVGQNGYFGAGGATTGVGVFTQRAGGNCASPVDYGTLNCAGGTQFCCPAGNYITLISGVMTKYTMITDPTNQSGEALCCPCPNGSCPSL